MNPIVQTGMGPDSYRLLIVFLVIQMTDGDRSDKKPSPSATSTSSWPPARCRRSCMDTANNGLQVTQVDSVPKDERNYKTGLPAGVRDPS